MKNLSEPIIFFGSGPVAAESLRLLAKHVTVEAAITKPRPAYHKGEFPAISAAQDLHIPIKTTTNKSGLHGIFESTKFKSRLGILIDFGIIVPQKVIDSFPLGIVNSHFSILPQWRGADPITSAILSGQQQTGVSLMLLVAGLYEGPLLAYDTCDIATDATTPSLTRLLIDLSNELLKETLPKYIAGEIKPTPQMATRRQVSYSHKTTKNEALLDWSKSADQLEREIRAFIEWPKSHASFGSLDMIVTKAQVQNLSGKPGTGTIFNKLPLIYCGKKSLLIERLKLAGKREMTGQAFLAGYRELFLSQAAKS